MYQHAMRFVLVALSVSLLFSCGSGTSELQSVDQAIAFKALAQAPAVQCSDAATIAAGAYQTVGLKGDRTVTAIGYNGYGELNTSPWSSMKAVAAGTFHTVGLNEDGTVVAIGYNTYGELNTSSWSHIKAVTASTYQTVGLKEDGTVVGVGDNRRGQLNFSSWTNIKAVAAGTYHTIGLKEDGTVVAVGYNGNGQLNVSSWTNIKAVAAGTFHTVGLKEDGTVVAIGSNNYGQLNVSSWTNIKAVAASTYHTIGLKEDGTVVAAGSNSYGELNVSTWTNIKAVASGTYHTVGLKEDGTVVAAGSNSYGQLDVSSWANIMPLCDSVCATNLDDIAPITSAVAAGTQGNNGWYVSDVQMTLTSTDNEGGSGVKGMYYAVDGAETVIEGSSATLSITGEGAHTVTFSAVDNAGNVETPAHVMSINIDKTSPSIPSLVADPAILWPPNHKMMDVFVGGAADDSGSGIDSTIITVTDEYGIYNATVAGFGNAIPLESWRNGSDRDGRVYTITVVATDKAGNSSTGTVTVLVPHDMK